MSCLGKNRFYEANISKSEFEILCKKFPNQSKTLHELTNFHGKKAIINLQRLMPNVKQRLGDELCDRLYQIAYSLTEARFFSYFYQLREIVTLPKSKVNTVLEIGLGMGVFESLISNFDYDLYTLDVNTRYTPDIVGNIMSLPIKDKVFDLVCAFEVLQHLPHRYFQQTMKGIAKCARHYVYISLPCPTNSLYIQCNLKLSQRFIRKFSFNFRLLRMLPTKIMDKDEGELLKRKDKHNPHYWEVNRRSFPKKRILREIEGCNLKIVKEFHNPSYPYHYFILCETL